VKITFALKEFFRDSRATRHQTNHFLLDRARVKVALTFEDSTEKVFVPPRGPNGRFVLDIQPSDIPDSVATSAPPVKQRISNMSLDFTVPLIPRDYLKGLDPVHAGKTFQLLRILQDFSLTALPTNSDQNIDYALSPFSWKHSALSGSLGRHRRRTANARVHPLLDLSKLSSNLVLMNALVLDLTELWSLLHEKNWKYWVHRVLSPADKVTFKVFAHLGGNAFIWYGVVPAYLATSTAVSPHVFYSPADYAEKQNLSDEKKYLFNNEVQFEARRAEPEEPAQGPGQAARRAQPGSDSAFDGGTLLLGYLLPPVDDDQIADLDPPQAVRLPIRGRVAERRAERARLRELSRDKFIEWVTRSRRNVVNFAYATVPRPDGSSARRQPPVIAPRHWNLGAGFERAFYGLGKKKPQQFLLMPQTIGRSGASADKGNESDRHLKAVTDTIVDLLQTNTELINHAADELVAKDKMILSCYSESGNDLWKASNTNIEHIKAIIGIEPNSTNPKGRDIIPKLLAKKIKVFIIGRHQGFNDHYCPKISEKLKAKIRFLPDKPREVLQYPPDPDSNDFVKYRVARVTDPELDPLMLEHERDILSDLAKRKKPIAGKAAIPLVFKQINNSDRLRDSGGIGGGIFYSHHFALTGGQDMKLAPGDVYKKPPVAYRTFFQQAIEEIG
jgi:hypothetical protein